jgi:Flp pilus assembly pilin Flp
LAYYFRHIELAGFRCNHGRGKYKADFNMNHILNIWNDDQGQDLIEYTLLMAFVALASAGLFLGAGGSVKGVWAVTNNQLAQANAKAS